MVECDDLVTTDEGTAQFIIDISRAQKCNNDLIETDCIAVTKNITAIGPELLTETARSIE